MYVFECQNSTDSLLVIHNSQDQPDQRLGNHKVVAVAVCMSLYVHDILPYC